MDFTLESALLFIAKTSPFTEEDYKNMEEAQKVVRESGLSRKEITELTRKVVKDDRQDQKAIREQKRIKEDKAKATKSAKNLNKSPMKNKIQKSMGLMGIGMKNNKGGAILKKNVEKMAYGGMSGGKKHMYLSPGGAVKDNPGLKALRASGPKGLEAYNKITGRNK
jgi:DNA-binding transcriptional MerR regulator